MYKKSHSSSLHLFVCAPLQDDSATLPINKWHSFYHPFNLDRLQDSFWPTEWNPSDAIWFWTEVSRVLGASLLPFGMLPQLKKLRPALLRMRAHRDKQTQMIISITCQTYEESHHKTVQFRLEAKWPVIVKTCSVSVTVENLRFCPTWKLIS